MTGPLAGIRVVDVTEGAQGPWAGALLADLGADVIKVEKPDGEMMRTSGPFKRGHALPNAGLNHGKRNIVLDLKEPAGREIMLRLIGDADVFMENWRARVAARLQVDYDVLAANQPAADLCLGQRLRPDREVRAQGPPSTGSRRRWAATSRSPAPRAAPASARASS